MVRGSCDGGDGEDNVRMRMVMVKKAFVMIMILEPILKNKIPIGCCCWSFRHHSSAV